MIKICSWCQEKGKHGFMGCDTHKPYDGLSHGLCKHCQPIYLRENGVPEKDIKELMDKGEEENEQA